MSRDVSHFDHLTRLLALEHTAQRARMAEEAQRLTLQERAARGLVWLDLEAVEDAVGLGGRVLVTLARADGQSLPAPLHNGDLVALRPRKAEDVAPVTGLVSRATRARVTLAFDRPPPPFVGEGRLRLDLVPNDITYQRARAAVERMKARERGQERRVRDVLLGAAAPKFGRLTEPTPTRPLNPEQREAVQRALAAEDFFLVHGPPGTGKSTVLAEVAVQAVANGQRLLACAASNAAVDHLLELCVDNGLSAVRVGHPGRVLERLQQHTLDVLVEEHPDRVLARELFDEALSLQGYARRQRTQGRSRERFAQARASSSEARQLMDEARALERKAVRSVLGKARVVCVTLGSLDTPVLADEEFDLALLDEATQAIEPLSLLPFLRAPRVVLAGDHKQLPPTVVSEAAARAGLSVSLFERLHADAPQEAHRMLREQYRMHADIMAFPSRTFYAGELRAHPGVASRTLAEVLTREGVDAPPVLFLDTAGKGFEEVQEEGGSFFNEGEAALVAARGRELLAAGLPSGELAVITPYSAQAALVRDMLGVPGVEVDTVDAFQGREKDAVLVSLVRSNGEGQVGFLAELRRMNVALTRPRRHLFVVGDSATLGGHPFYEDFMASTQAQGGYRSAWEWPEPERG